MNGASLRYLDEHFIREKEYWLQKLSGDLVITGIPLDHSRPAAWQNGKAVIDIKIDSDNQSRLQNVCGGKDPLIFTVLVAALKIVLHKYTGSEDIIVGTTVQRGYKELASLNHVLALRDRVSGSLKIRDFLENVRQTVSESYASQKYSFKRLLELLNIELPSNRAPLFSVMVVIDSIHDRENARDLKQDLTLSFSSNGGGLSGVVEFSPALFRRDTIEVFVEHYKRALHTVLSRPDIAISEIELLSPGRKHERIFGFNNTESDYPKDKTIHQLFQDLAARTPGEVAVALGASQLTYYELNSRANQLAHYLRKLGITRGKIVGLFVDHSIEMIVGMLGTLKAGGAYLPLDSSHPRARLAFMLEDAQISLVLTQRRLVDRLPPHAGDTLCLDSDWELVARESEQNPECDAAADDLAYLIYTSGSTGKPKGVKIQHRSLVNYAWWAKDVYVRGERVTFPLYSSLAFDLTVTSIFTPLITGNRIVIYHWEGREVDLEEIIKDERIDIIKLTPSHLSLIKDKDNRRSRIKRLIVGGEALETGLARQALENFGEGVEIFNEYGPTEATVGCMIHKFDPLKDDRAYVPIGRPAANVQIYVLDEDLLPVAENVFGELYISGEGLAEGYLNCEDLTLERFIKNPFLTGRRIYKTGDLARWLPGDVLEYVGRTDDQVKFHGYRVEMNEIRCALNRHPQVRDSIVVLTKDPYGHDVMLAYYVSRRELAAAELRSFMAESIIEETLPNIFVHLTKLPLTLNGKINYGALPDLNAARSRIKREYEAASTATEKLVAGIWSQVLRIEQVGIHDNFFELGGHSLLATQVRSRLAQKLGIEVPMADLFKHPILTDFARAIEGFARAELPPITRVERNGRLELSFAQQRLWFLSQFEGASEAYHIAGGLRLLGSVDRSALRRALNRIVARHEVLRTTFSQVDGRPAQIIGPADTEFLLLEHDLRFAPDRSAALERLAADEAGQPFDLEHGPLIRGRLAQLDQDDHALLVTMHHIVSDGWSMGILINELSQLYRAYCDGRAEDLPSLPAQYADYAAWQRGWLSGELWRKQAQYWEQTLAGAPAVLELPADRPRPAQQDYAGGMVEIELDEHLTSDLKSLGRRHGATLYMTLLAGWAALLGRLSGQEEMVIGTPAANRTRQEIEPLIGFFVNTLALRIDLAGSPTVSELLARVKTRTLEAQQYQDLPFEQVVEIAQPARSLAHSPIFQTVFAWQNAPEGALDLPGLTLSLLATPHVTARFDVTLSLREAGQRIVGWVEYATALFDCATVRRFIEYWRTLLGAMTAGDEQAIDRLPLLGERERRQILVEWNATDADYPRERCVHELFEAQAEKTPTAIALVHGERRLAYGELNAQANRLARRLLNLGLKPEARIAIRLERSIELVVAQLAALKCGAVYVPIDPAFPAERQIFLAADCAAQAVITTRMATIPEPLAAMRVDIEDPGRFEAPSGNPRLALQSETPAYVMYTSGSTGQPKGVMVPHRAIGRLVLNCGYADFNSLDRVAFAANPAFDAATMEVWAPLLNGGRIVVIDQHCLLDPALFGQTLERQGVSVLWLTAGLFNQYAESLAETFGRLRYLIVGGEALDPQVIAGQLYRCPPRHLVNGYGPTETTTFAITHEIREVPEEARSIPLGRPINNTRIYILDVNRQPVPIGVAGEIYIGGAGVAKGYLNRPDLTEEKFLPDPFRLEPESRMYRTGDMGRWLPDGKIEFLGRNDFQIKIRGFRVELGEIEAALTRHSQVREAVIIARENQETGKQLVAYYTGEEIGAEALRLYLSAMLPDYMAPVAYVHLESLPLTQNGKLDRRALPAPEGQAFISRGYEAPLNETESRIAQIWAALLSLDRVGRLDNFFDLGGHSLLATQVISRVREVFKLELPLRVLFEAPTLAELAAQVDRANQAAQGVSLPPIIPIASGSPLPLSFAQQRLWYIDQLHPGSSLYNCPIAVELSGDLDIQALERTLTEIIRRHEVLRTSFPIIDGNPIQHISEAEPVSLPVLDLTELNESARDSEARRLIVEEATRPFCLARGPLLRTSLIRLDKQKHIARLTMHHITSDAWSLSVLMREVATLYEAYSKGLPSPLSELSIQYADFAAWQRKRLQGEVLERELNYWKEQLKNVAVIELPTDHARPPSPSYRGGRERVELGREVCEGLRRLSQREGVTMFMALMAAFKALLMKYSGQEDLSIGTSIANRTRKEVEELIGFFVNTLVMRTNLGGNPSFRELTEREREVALGAYGHQEIPFEKLVEEINPQRDLSRNPLFQVMMELQNTRREEYELRDLKLSGMGEELVMAKFDLRLMLTEEREGLSGSLEYSRDLYEGETISRMARHYERVVKEVVRDADQRIRWIELLSETEKRQIIEEWNETERAYGGARLVHEMIAEQAERSGDAIAVRSEQGELSYQKLNRLGNQLGNYLQGLGVGPEVVVGMYLERSMEMVVALLGVLKAGGCYLPLDPEYPLERLGYLLEDAGAGIVLTQRGIEAGLPAFMGQIVCLDEEWERIKEQSESAPESEVEAENLAYVIYTSGSSGRPKGVMINHGGVVNYLRWATETYGIGEGEGAPVNSSIGFDLTVTSLYGPLVNGKSVKLLSEEEGIEALARDLSQERGYSLVKITPAHLDLLTEQLRNTEVEGRTRVLVIGGEELKAGGLKNWQERAKATRLINEYGPTETVVGCCVYEVEGKECEREATPIGRPISNAQIYILNGELEPAPIGVRGEIYISGAGVGRGYLGKPELTAERFIPHRFSRSGGERVYRTGDVGRYRADGNIEFLGRIDHQVKIRGFRIELGEIEAALNRHPAVREAVVVARQDQDSGKRLVAYYTGEEIGAEALRLHLSATLPDYMAPAAYVHLESLPLTQNGKLDRLALPAPEGQAYTTGGYEPPVNETEAKLAQIWADLLKLERVGRFDNFFDLGGHSLLLVELQNRLQSAFERDVLIAEMFRYPTVSSLARYITKGRNETGRSRAVTERAKRRREALDRRSSRFSPAE